MSLSSADGLLYFQFRKIGLEGAFYTSSHLGPVFGQMLAIQLEEMWELMGKGSFTIVGFGADKGYLLSIL